MFVDLYTLRHYALGAYSKNNEPRKTKTSYKSGLRDLYISLLPITLFKSLVRRVVVKLQIKYHVEVWNLMDHFTRLVGNEEEIPFMSS